MAEQERRIYLRLALDAAQMAIWDSDFSDGNITKGGVTWSKPAALLLGIHSGGFRHAFDDFLSFVHADDRERVLTTFQQSVEKIQDYELEYRVVWADESVHWLAARGSMLTNEAGQPSRTLGIIWEITDRKQQEERFMLALDAANIAMSEWNLATDAMRWTGHAAAMLGFTPDALHSTRDEFLQQVHPADRERISLSLQTARNSAEPHELEYRIILPDGQVRWIASIGHVHVKGPHESGRVLALITDITERKQDHLTLQHQKELAELTLASIGDAIITTDVSGKIRMLNRVAEQITGWPQTLAMGYEIDTVLRLVDEATATPVDNPVRKVLQLGQPISMSSRTLLLSRDGRRVAIRDSASPIRAANGDIIGAVMIFYDVSHERQLLTELSWQASHDPLTGLINRREFESHVATALTTAKRERDQHALLYMDLDQFKIVNDTCGHVAGDELLRQLSALLQSHMRESDVLARLGGDEMGVLLLNCPIEQAHYFADNLRQIIHDFRFVWHTHQFELGVSIGLVAINEYSKPLTELMSAADAACYTAKQEGRNQVHLSSESGAEPGHHHGEMLWATRISEAFDAKRFRLFIQPIANLNGSGALHFEMLLRMEDQQGKLVLPGAFLPAAERYDMMPDIDRWVINAVLSHLHQREIQRVVSEGDGSEDDSTYAINLSGISLNDNALVTYIAEQFDEYGIQPERICFEITETAAIGNLAQAKHFIEQVKQLGCRFSLDDFGSGLSSFAYLKNLPVDYLKIDGNFIKNIAADPIDLAMVIAINNVGHVMGIKTIAEFVESAGTLEKIREIGVDFAQGYAVGQPHELRSHRGRSFGLMRQGA